MENILLIVPSIGLGGLEQVALTTAFVLKKKYKIFFVYFYNNENNNLQEACQPINPYCLNVPWSAHMLGKICAMVKRNILLRRFKKKNNINCSISFGKVASISNIFSRGSETCIASIHGYADFSKSILRAFIDRLIFSKADKTICVSQGLYNKFVASMHIEKSKVAMLYNPFDIKKIEEKAKEKGCKVRGNPALFSHGRFVKEKNLESQILALKKVVKIYPEACLNLLGDGDNKSELMRLADMMGVKEHVYFLDQDQNPYKYLKEADIYISTSFNEGFACAPIEAMICGVPVIVADCKTGMRENLYNTPDLELVAVNIEQADYGILIPPFYIHDNREARGKKIEFLVDAIELLYENKELMEHYQKQGWLRARRYDIGEYEKGLMHILEDFYA